jgi:membrane-associated phospholipid phosphatase
MKKEKHRLIFYVIGVIFLGFIVLSALVYIFPNSIVDYWFSKEIQEHQSPVLDSLMKIISWPGYMPRSLISIVLVAGIFYLAKFKKEAFYILLTLLSGVVSAILKLAVNRPRPTEPLIKIIETAKSQSFPSGHVILYVVFFGFITVLMVRLKSISGVVRGIVAAVSLVFIFSVPFSRMYLGAHWFTDVLGGFLSGVICLYIISYQYLRKED